mmetsp:Transcript_18313/g.41900  ORF Transcript_18313/g.41900 Transcript_18313/m.41900 type:complete len:107 (+) Transcript_18313:785-1105(+)
MFHKKERIKFEAMEAKLLIKAKADDRRKESAIHDKKKKLQEAARGQNSLTVGSFGSFNTFIPPLSDLNTHTVVSFLPFFLIQQFKLTLTCSPPLPMQDTEEVLIIR